MNMWTGTFDAATKTFTFTGNEMDMSGKKVKFRTTIDCSNKDTQVKTGFKPGRDGKEFKAFEFTLTRKKGSDRSQPGSAGARIPSRTHFGGIPFPGASEFACRSFRFLRFESFAVGVAPQVHGHISAPRSPAVGFPFQLGRRHPGRGHQRAFQNQIRARPRIR